MPKNTGPVPPDLYMQTPKMIYCRDFYVAKQLYSCLYSWVLILIEKRGTITLENIPQNQRIQTFLEEIYNRYKLPLLRIVRKYVGESDICEDIFHEIFIRIIRSAEMLSGFSQQKLEAYMSLVARGVSIDYLRKKYKNNQVDIDDDILFNFPEGNTQLTAGSLTLFNKVDLTLMIEKLPVEERILLVGKYYLGLSINDLSEILGSTSTTTRSKIHRAKKRVFDEWSKSGLNMEDFIDG